MTLYKFRECSLILLLFFTLFLIDCRRKESSGTKEQILSFLLNQSLTQSSDPCTAFAATEGLCVLAQTDALQTCSEKEKSRIKKSIEPLEKQTNEVLNKFYDCWRRCNLVFNAQEPICKEPKFSTLEVYRNAQKSGQSSASKSWILCINSCNQGEAEETKGLGAIFKGWAY